MRRQPTSVEGSPVRSALVEATLEAGFALVRLAEGQSGGDSRRILGEARMACRECERRMARLDGDGLRQFRRRCADLRHAIARASGKPAGARILQMPVQKAQ